MFIYALVPPDNGNFKYIVFVPNNEPLALRVNVILEDYSSLINPN